jgi:hypothetical protein
MDTGGGIISSQGGHFPLVNDQLDFLTSELERLKPARQAGERAILIAVHHPTTVGRCQDRRQHWTYPGHRCLL